MEGLKETFSKKLGPLPVWAWAALVVAAIVGWMYWKKIGIFAPSSGDTATSADQGGGYDPNKITDTGGAGGGGGLGDSLGDPSTLRDPNRAGSTGTGNSQPASWTDSGYASLTPDIGLAAQPDATATPSGSGVNYASIAAQAPIGGPNSSTRTFYQPAPTPPPVYYAPGTSIPAQTQGNPVSDYGRGL
jgi:hypothetical protein